MEHTDSQIGYASSTLIGPSDASDSAIGYTSATFRRPHHPVGIKTDAGVKYVPLIVWTGSGWR